MNVRKSKERGHANLGWLNSYHTFSFGEYYDPAHMGFRFLRVINDDVIEAGGGFGMHPHKNMEIISYVVEGELEHKDSMGNGSVIKKGGFQKMSAGTGVTHSEFNPSKSKTRLLQIWILPSQQGLTPSYQELTAQQLKNKKGLILVASHNDLPDVIKIHQHVDMYLGILAQGQHATHDLKPKAAAWIQMVSGQLDVNGTRLEEGDGVSIDKGGQLKLSTTGDAEFLLFDFDN